MHFLERIFAQLSDLTTTFFARAQLQKLRKAFMRSSARKLCNLLKRTRPEGATPEALVAPKDASRR